MKEKKRSNGITPYVKFSILFTILCLVAYLGINVFSQSEKNIENKSIVEQNHKDLQNSDEIQKLIEILKNGEIKEKSSQLIIEAIQKLGNIKARNAIPELIEYLDFERKFESTQKQDPNLKIDPLEVTHWQDRPLSGRYPAISALFQIGKPALPSLVKVIKENDVDSVKSKNALEVIQLIFRDDLSEGVKYLENAVGESKTQDGQQRLQNALEKTREEWIKIQNSMPN